MIAIYCELKAEKNELFLHGFILGKTRSNLRRDNLCCNHFRNKLCPYCIRKKSQSRENKAFQMILRETSR